MHTTYNFNIVISLSRPNYYILLKTFFFCAGHKTWKKVSKKTKQRKCLKMRHIEYAVRSQANEVYSSYPYAIMLCVDGLKRSVSTKQITVALIADVSNNNKHFALLRESGAARDVRFAHGSVRVSIYVNCFNTHGQREIGLRKTMC